jgi:eukaryotic-like serine/threonine-protein kinase
MERTTFLDYYRIRTRRDGTPIELRRTGAAITYEAADERSGEIVALTIIPIESVDSAAQQQFEEQARALQRLRHINIVKLLDFGREAENFVCVSDYLEGVTLAEWVGRHGPMAPDATLRMAEQVVSVLSSANFHKLAYPAIQPSNIIVVPGVTPEDTWPLIKLMDLGLPGFKADSGATEKGEESLPIPPELPSVEAQKLPGPEKAVDFRSQIFSLGATMYFLLTGSELSTPVRRRQLRMFPKPLRALLFQMLHRNPDQRPKDAVALAEMIRQCLLKVERRERFARRFGIPLMSKIPRTTKRRPERLRPIALAAGALVIAAAVIALFLFPQRIGRILGHHREPKTIGVLVGVPESSPTPGVQNAPTPMTSETALAQAAQTALAFGQQSQPNTSTAPSSSQVAPPDAQSQTPTEQTSNAQVEATANPANAPGESPNTVGAAAQSSMQANATPQPAGTSQTSSRSKKKPVASTSRDHVGSTRARMIGITSDGKLIYRLPSGRTRVVAPDADQDRDQFVPRRHRRALIERDETSTPMQPFEPDVSPYD